MNLFKITSYFSFIIVFILSTPSSHSIESKFLEFDSILPDIMEFKFDGGSGVKAIRLDQKESEFLQSKTELKGLKKNLPGSKNYTQKLDGNSLFSSISVNYFFGEKLLIPKNKQVFFQNLDQYKASYGNRGDFLRQKSVLYSKRNVTNFELYYLSLDQLLRYYADKYGSPEKSEVLLRVLPASGSEEYIAYVDWSINAFSKMRICFSPTEKLKDNYFFIMITICDVGHYEDLFPNKVSEPFEVDVSTLETSEFKRYANIIKDELSK
ncbi:MAG: hypothetical protein P9L94_13445 [Candidatus Hinthialibacter antarcticus]|nr:hypothetical protein [Candidatus Hinthialibacter antarcticus]